MRGKLCALHGDLGEIRRGIETVADLLRGG
jgi:hypothetical protein